MVFIIRSRGIIFNTVKRLGFILHRVIFRDTAVEKAEKGTKGAKNVTHVQQCRSNGVSSQ